jgi:hypothetical protein
MSRRKRRRVAVVPHPDADGRSFYLDLGARVDGGLSRQVVALRGWAVTIPYRSPASIDGARDAVELHQDDAPRGSVTASRQPRGNARR